MADLFRSLVFNQIIQASFSGFSPAASRALSPFMPDFTGHPLHLTDGSAAM
jgi:hypothetical protein